VPLRLQASIYTVCSGIIFTTITYNPAAWLFAFWYLIRTIVSLRSIEEMKDDFTNNMTHELKTPIAVTYSAVDALCSTSEQGDDKGKREQYLKICEEQLKRLSGLVEKILSMSMERRKTLAMNKEDVALRPMIESMAKEFRLKNDKKMTLHHRHFTRRYDHSCRPDAHQQCHQQHHRQQHQVFR
jgi:signal transduction histidine kinase